MVTIKRSRIRDKLSDIFSQDLRWDNLKYPIYYRKRHLITRHFIALALTVACLICAPFSHFAWILSLSLISFLTILYFIAKKMAEGIILKRVPPLRGHEMRVAKVSYEIQNNSFFQIRNLILSDSFSGAKSHYKTWVIKDLDAQEKVNAPQKYLCDGGMGTHSFGPLTALVSDPLGFFDFLITEDEKAQIFVYPELIPIPNLPVEGSKDSLQYGLHDVSQRGASVNFMGIREYVSGDPIKQISWRLSFRHQKLMVKEFEKIVNAEVTILLDMDSRFHAGQAAESTWEYARDATLAICAQQLVLGNSVQVLSQGGYIPMGRGDEHAHFISLCMPRFSPEENQKDIVKVYWDLIPKGSTVFYISPWFDPALSPSLKSLGLLASRNMQIFGIFFDGGSFVKKKLFSTLQVLNDIQMLELRKAQAKTLKQLSTAGINSVLMENGSSIAKSLLRLSAR